MHESESPRKARRRKSLRPDLDIDIPPTSMSELLNQVKKTLAAVIAELERQEAVPLNQDTLIIPKEEFKYLKYEGNPENSLIIFSFKQEVCFSFLSRNEYQNQLYRALMQNKLERIILHKRETPVQYGNGSYLVNYRIEDEENTKLRELYIEGSNP
jgi:hypothetical protein